MREIDRIIAPLEAAGLEPGISATGYADTAWPDNRTAIELDVTLKVDAKWGETWGDME